MQTIEECFAQYLESFDATEFDPHSLAEMRFCFFAGAIAMRIVVNQIVSRLVEDGDIMAAGRSNKAVERELEIFVAEQEGRDKLRVN